MTRSRVQLESEEPSGLAEMLAGLLEQNLDRRPERASLLRPSVVLLEVPDSGVIVSVRTWPGGLRVADGNVRDADLRVVANADRLLATASAPLRAGLPDPLRPAGRAVLADVVTGRIRVHGLVRHPVRLARFISLLSVHEPVRGTARP